MWLAPVAVGCAFWALYLVCRSNDFCAVDGAVRCIDVYRERVFLHGNNHMLYPFWVRAWAGGMGLLGLHAANALEFMRLAQAFGALIGGISIACFYVILRAASDDLAAFIGSALLGLSNAFLLHATNSAEVLPGFALCLLSLACLTVGLRSCRNGLLSLAGLVLAAALATYQAMGLVVPLMVTACFACAHSDAGVVWRRRGTVSVALVALGGLVGVVAIYGAAYASQGIPFSAMPKAFLAVGGSPEVYGGFTPQKSANVAFGAVVNLVRMPFHYSGIRSSLLPAPTRVLAFLAVFALLAGIVAAGFPGWRSLFWMRGGGYLLGAVAVSGICLGFPLVYWDPLYDKLWLLPLAAGIWSVCITLRPGALAMPRRHVLLALLGVVLAGELSLNATAAVQAARVPTPGLEQARQLQAMVTARDRVVLGWDPVSILFANFFGSPDQFLVLPSTQRGEAERWLVSARRSTRGDGGRLLVVGQLDADETQWNAFLGSRLKIPYDILATERCRRKAVERWEFLGGSLTVWRDGRPLESSK